MMHQCKSIMFRTNINLNDYIYIYYIDICIYRYPDPWRIVFPAMYFNFAFITISMYTDYNFQQGYKAFSKNMRNITSEMYNICKKVADVRYQC